MEPWNEWMKPIIQSVNPKNSMNSSGHHLNGQPHTNDRVE